MFKKNDEALLLARTLILVALVSLAVSSVITGFVLAFTVSAVLILITFAGLFLCFLLWVFTSLYLSYLCDIKLIRNKLYGESNDGLKDFLGGNNNSARSHAISPATQEKKQAVNTGLAYSQQHLNSGAITPEEEEYERRKEAEERKEVEECKKTEEHQEIRREELEREDGIFELKELSDGTYKIVGVKNKSIANAIIPNDVTSIGYGAFKDCKNLTNITIPNSVTSIREKAFCDCESLTDITIPNSVTSIGWGAFSGCSNLISITIPNGVTSIGYEAFCGCESLTYITIPNGVSLIGKNAFAGCSSLTRITVPQNCDCAPDAFPDWCMVTRR